MSKIAWLNSRTLLEIDLGRCYSVRTSALVEPDRTDVRQWNKAKSTDKIHWLGNAESGMVFAGNARPLDNRSCDDGESCPWSIT